MNAAIQAAPGWARALLEDERVAHLGLHDEEDLPRVLPVTFTLYDGALWTAVDNKPKADSQRELARLRFLRRQPQVALTVDRYDDAWEKLAWVQVLGVTSILAVDECEAAIETLAEKYGQYRSAPPPGPLIRIEPGRVLAWSTEELR